MFRSVIKNSIPPLVLILIGSANLGCSKAGWQARMYLYRAEQIMWKTNTKLKNKKVPFIERKKYYAEACDYYLKAYDVAPGIFNAGKLEDANSSCFNAENFEASHKLETIYGAYCQKHPKECEYGYMSSTEWY